MANDNDLSYEITADGRQARKEIGSVYDLLARLSPIADKAGKSLDEVGAGGLKELRSYATTLERVDALLDNLETRQARNASTRSKAESSAFLGQSKAVYGDDENRSKAELAAQRALAAEEQRTITLRQQANRDLESASRILLTNAQIERVANQQRIDNLREEERLTDRVARAREQATRAAARAEADRIKQVISAARNERSSALAAERASATQAAFASGAQTGPKHAAVVDAHDVSQINATRYALYDVAQTAGIAGTAIAGIGGSAVAAATTSQAAFADVQRAMDVPFEKAKQLRGELMDLTTTMPTSFTDVAGAAQLGAQLGVANNDLDAFTESVVKFAATTDVSVEAAGTAFGRLGQLLDVPASQYENLSSAIYQVGIDSVATESEIISTSTQIAGAASAYNFTADQVVGLSAAFASLGIAPEAARGSVTRIFGDIEKAVGEGGDALKPFTRLLGVSAEEATKLWNSDPSRFFSQLVSGLSKSNDLLGDLSSIGANDVRDVNLLQRLSTNSELLAKSLNTAKQSYDEGTATSEGYAVTADTLAAKLQQLVNSFVKLGDAAGAPLLGPIGAGVDLLKSMVVAISDSNPATLAFAAALAILVGGFLLFRAGVATAMAAVLALRFVIQQLGTTAGTTGVNIGSLKAQLALLRTEMGATSGAAARADLAVDKVGKTSLRTRLGLLNMGTVMNALGWASVVAGGLQVASSLIQTYISSQQAAKGLQDVQNAAGPLSANKLVASFKEANAEVSKFGDDFAGRSGGIDQLNAQVNSFFNQFINATPGLNNAKKELEAIDGQLAQLASGGKGEEAAAAIAQMGLSASEVKQQFPQYVAAVQEAEQAQLNQGAAATAAAGDLDSYESSIDSAKQSVDSLFGALNQQSDFASAIQQLFSGIYDAGNAFGYLNETGRANLENLQAAMAQTIAYGETVGLSATNSVAALFYQLQQSGVDTSSLLQLIASQPYMFSADLDISKVQQKLAQLGVNGGTATGVAKNATAFNGLTTSMNKLAVSAPRAATGISKTQKAAQKAAKEVKTLSDYASDLSNVFSASNDYRFGYSDALDDIKKKWDDVNESVADNKKQVAENAKSSAESFADYKDKIEDARLSLNQLNADLAKLRASLTTQKYFLSVAVQYGDNLRAGEIQAEIGDLNAQIADKQRDANKAQKEAKTPYEDTTEAIKFQRASLGDLYESYQKAITEYARSGATQDQLRVKVAQLREDFVRQATQAGYSTTEINKYANAFNDMTIAINGVPRKITVSANTNPAFQALNDFLAKAKAAKAEPSVGGSGTTNQARQNGVDAGTAFGTAYKEAAKRNMAFQIEATLPKDANGNRQAKSFIGGLTMYARGGGIPGFPTGGVVPGSAPADRRYDNVAAMSPSGMLSLQGGEFIMTNAARSKYGDELFNSINSLRFSPTVVRPQVTVQGGSGGMVELSPYDRSLLADIANRVGLTISSTAVQNASNAGNNSSSRRMVG